MMKKIRSSLLLVATTLLAVVAFALPAHADYEAYGYWSEYNINCSGLLTTCSQSLRHRVDSYQSECHGSYGSYTECKVYHECWLDSSGGPFLASTLTCDYADPAAPPCAILDGSCNLHASGAVWVPRGSCYSFYARGTTSSTLGSISRTHSFTVCVDWYGPYMY